MGNLNSQSTSWLFPMHFGHTVIKKKHATVIQKSFNKETFCARSGKVTAADLLLRSRPSLIYILYEVTQRWSIGIKGKVDDVHNCRVECCSKLFRLQTSVPQYGAQALLKPLSGTYLVVKVEPAQIPGFGCSPVTVSESSLWKYSSFVRQIDS